MHKFPRVYSNSIARGISMLYADIYFLTYNLCMHLRRVLAPRGPRDDDTTLDRDTRRTNPTIDYLFQAMRSESKFHTRRETDPTCLTPAAGYTEGITRPKVLPRQSDSAFTEPSVVHAAPIHFEDFDGGHLSRFPRLTKTSMDYVSASLYKVTWKSANVS